jgi:hypothetical protein
LLGAGGSSKAKAMTVQRQAPHLNEQVPQSTSLLQTLFLFSALLAFQVGLPGLLAAREGGPTVFAVFLASLCVVALAWWRCHRRESTSPRRIRRGI